MRYNKKTILVLVITLIFLIIPIVFKDYFDNTYIEYVNIIEYLVLLPIAVLIILEGGLGILFHIGLSILFAYIIFGQVKQYQNDSLYKYNLIIHIVIVIICVCLFYPNYIALRDSISELLN